MSPLLNAMTMKLAPPEKEHGMQTWRFGRRFFLLLLGVIPNAVLQFIFGGSAMSPSTDSRVKHFFSNQANYNEITANVMNRNCVPIQTLLEMRLTAYNSECWANTSYTIFLKKNHDASPCSMWIFLADMNCHRGGKSVTFWPPRQMLRK